MSHRTLIAFAAASFFGAVAPQSLAGVIVETPAELASQFTMTDFPADPRADDSPVTTVASPLGGNIEFWTENHGAPLAMTLDKDSGWFPANLGEVYSTAVSWVELILPENTRAFSFNVGASGNGSGWVQAFDDTGANAYRAFTLGANNAPGFGFAATGACGSLSKVIVEPWQWGVGNFAISQGSCPTQVPEPGTLGLLLTGFLGLVALRRRRIC
jgi:hypothetical protein